ncbi:hypothetical protein [Bosea thiooxidans]
MIRLNFQQGLDGPVRPVPVWAAWLGAAASIAIGVVLFLVAASLALIVIPLAAVAGAIALWRFKARLRAELKARAANPGDPFAQAQQGGRIKIIDAEYRIVEPDEPARR